MKNRILELIKTNPSRYADHIAKDPEMVKWVEDNNSSITEYWPEKIYSAVYQESNICEKYKSKKKFRSVGRGYGFCHRHCECHKEQCAADGIKNFNWSENREELLSKRHETNIERHGEDYTFKRAAKAVETYKNKTQEEKSYIVDTQHRKMVENYGEEYGKLRYEKIKQTNFERYGYELNYLDPLFKEKSKQKSLERYGTEFPMQSDIIKDKRRLSFYGQEKYNLLEIEDNFKAFIKGKTIVSAAQELLSDRDTIANKLNRWNCWDLIDQTSRSKEEVKIKNLLLANNINFISNNRKIIYPKELDFYLPDHNIAFEHNGLWHHSELSGGKDRHYHYNKWNQCKDQGIDLYSWWDIEVKDKWPVIESKILYLTKKKHPIIVGARKLTIRQVGFAEESSFLSKNHIQGFTQNRNLCYGGYIDGKLITLISIRCHKSTIWEVVRFAVDLDYSVPGGFMKLLKYAIKEHKFSGQVTSISDNCHSNGNLYSVTVFEPVNYQKEAYFYTKNYQEKLSRQAFMKDKIQSKFGVDPEYVKSKTEWELMQELGYDRVWDCGKIKWMLNV